MNSYVAEIPELVRAHRKDEDHIEELSAAASQLVKDTFGPRIWIRYYREIAVAAELVYYAATTVSGNFATFICDIIYNRSRLLIFEMKAILVL